MTEPPQEQAQQVATGVGCLGWTVWEIVASIAGLALAGLRWKLFA